MSNEDGSPQALNEHHGSTSEAGSEEEENVVQSLVVGRAKRATAGNRLSSLLEKEGDDELELLFAENGEEEDVEFEEEEVDASDAQLDSSSDDEDQGPTKDDYDLTGEKELQKQDRLDRQKKRKAQGILKRPERMPKKAKIDPSVTPNETTTPAPRQRKKSERVSWVHTAADAPTRTSSRKQTVENREATHQKLIDDEQARIKTMRYMEEAQRRKEAMKPKAMTQADRLEEAAKTERRNAKSLNRWEESEKKRVEEQKAKLEALHNRQLNGPVISSWSGLARWVNGKIGQLGVKEIREAGHTEKSTKTGLNAQTPHTGSDLTSLTNRQDTVISGGTQMQPTNGYYRSNAKQIEFAPPRGLYGFLDGIHAYASLPVQRQQAEFTGTADGGLGYPGPPAQGYRNQYGGGHTYPPPPKPIVPDIEFSSRNLVALKNIDANASRTPELQNNVLLKRRVGKLQS